LQIVAKNSLHHSAAVSREHIFYRAIALGSRAERLQLSSVCLKPKTFTCDPWRTLDAVENVGTGMVDEFNDRMLLDLIGPVPCAEFAQKYYP